MAVITNERPERTRRLRWFGLRLGSRPTRRTRGRPLKLLPQGMLLMGAALAVIVAPGGTTVGGVVRLLTVVALTGYAFLADRSANLVQRAALAVGVGAVGGATGYAIGISHTAMEGLTLRATAGLLAMMVGISMLLTGLVAMFRLLPGSRARLLLLVCVPLSLQFVLTPLATAVEAANPPPSRLGLTTPGDRGYPYDDIQMVTRDGVLLDGWYVPSRNTAAIAFVPDAGTTRSSMLARATSLARAGYGVLLFDTRGNGDSGGDAAAFGWSGERDVEAAVTFLSDRYDVNPRKIGLVGVGRGGDSVVTASAIDGRIQAAVAEGVGRRTVTDSLTLPVSPQGVLQGITESLGYVAGGLLRQSVPPRSLRDAVRATASMPLLLVAEQGSVDASRLYRRTEPDNVSVWELPSVPPGQAYSARTAAWEEQVTTFLDDALVPRPVPRQ